MSSRIVCFAAIVSLGASASALAQTPTDLTFTATGTQCDEVNWSSQTLARYPRIAQACQAVVQRDGKYFVVFSGTVTHVAGFGRTLEVDFKDGDHIRLNPPPDMRFDIAGTMTRARDIQPGQELKFYVPQDRFVAEVPQGEKVSAPIPMTVSEPQRVAEAKTAPPQNLPQTGTDLGVLALGGLALMLTGAGLTTLRYRRGAR